MTLSAIGEQREELWEDVSEESTERPGEVLGNPNRCGARTVRVRVVVTFGRYGEKVDMESVDCCDGEVANGSLRS